MNKAVAKYLRLYAEPECAALENFPAISPRACLVIPSYAEAPDFARRLAASPLGNCGLLVIVVINQAPGAEEYLNRNLFYYFQQRPVVWQQDNLALYQENHSQLHWLVVDRFSSGREIDPQHGVGLARKIGCDLAAFLLAKNAGGSRWICTTDADATLPDHYFSALEACSEPASAAVFSVQHVAMPGADPSIFAATRLYERALTYYVDGLAWAGSPYAFPTVGSALAISLQAYCECRGFPRRAGGEDFYLLNKSAKIGPVVWLKNTVIQIEARISARTPFGTGPAVKKILALENMADFAYYAPEVFVDLRTWLHHIPAVWECLQAGRDPLENLPERFRSVLIDAGIASLWLHIRRQIDSPLRCERAVHNWFDAFQTLKFIRRLQELCYPSQPLENCLLNAPFYRNELPCWKS